MNDGSSIKPKQPVISQSDEKTPEKIFHKGRNFR
jgi:hypothetical protein